MTAGLELSTNMSYWSNLVQVQTQASICSMNQYSLETHSVQNGTKSFQQMTAAVFTGEPGE